MMNQLFPFNKPLTADLLLQDDLIQMTETFQEIMVISDYWIVKLDANGNLVWQKSLGGSSGDYATSIQQTSDGGFIVAGSSNSNDGDVSGNHGGLVIIGS